MKLALTFLIISTISCSTGRDEKLRAWEAWNGRSVEDISKSAYFKSLPVTKMKHENGLETWIYRDQTRFQTDAFCQSLGGCMGLPTYNCQNAFSVKDEVILGFEQSGSCPGLKSIRPMDK